MEGIGDRFQRETKYHPDRMSGSSLDWDAQPKPYKEYPDAPKTTLPSFTPSRPTTLDETLRRRRSVRDFSAQPISLGQLSYLLWASTGIGRTEQGYAFRTAPSAGALYPIETYVVANRISKLDTGLYHYNTREHGLEQLRTGDLRRAVTAAALGQGMCATAAVVFVWAAVVERCKWKYRQRAYRYIYLDAGHIAENLALAATSLNLGSCQIGALFDDEVNAIIGLDGIEETVVYMSVVGAGA